MNHNLDDAEFETLVRLLDQAMASQDARVQDALRSLLVITSLTASDQSDLTQPGPLSEMRARVQSLTQSVSALERRMHDLERGEWESRRLKAQDEYWLSKRMSEYQVASWPRTLPGDWLKPNPNSDI